MFFFGMLGALQTTFLPGFIILKFFKLEKSTIQTLAFSFGLSQVFNYLLVFLLTLLGIYLRPVVLVLFAALLIFAQGSAVAPFIYTLF